MKDFSKGAIIHKQLHELDDGKVVLQSTEDITGLVDLCADLRAAEEFGTKDMHYVAEIPGMLIEHYCNTFHVSWEEFMKEPKHIKALLNDPTWAAFRIKPGRV